MPEKEVLFITTRYGGVALSAITQYEITREGLNLFVETKDGLKNTIYPLDGELADRALYVLQTVSS